MLVLGLVPLDEAVRGELADWNVFLFFLGMMAIAALADQSGVFDRVAFLAARAAGGRVVSLYVAIFLLGTGISLLFANDSAALVLTPIVYALVVRLALDPLPFVFATTFIADTASLGLPVSNPLNIIVADSFHLDLASYVAHLWLPALLAIALNVGLFLLLFRRRLGGTFHRIPEPETHQLSATTAILMLVAICYLAASAIRFPLGIVSVAGAAALALNLLRIRALDVARAAREISFPIFGFIGGMVIVVQGLAGAGVTRALGHALVRTSTGSHLGTIGAAAIGTAVGSNLVNNLPMALIMVSVIHPLHVSAAIRLDLVYGTIVGCDLGPNLTHLGSLATLLWLFFLRRQGLDVSTWEYFRIGVLVTPLLLLGAVLGLWVTSIA